MQHQVSTFSEEQANHMKEMKKEVKKVDEIFEQLKIMHAQMTHKNKVINVDNSGIGSSNTDPLQENILITPEKTQQHMDIFKSNVEKRKSQEDEHSLPATKK